ncbi:sensor domain-containing diguanylate cyclase [Neptunicella marina]|uniref:diguanylate cyclase n=1 Tax=Neptunicella marina TaxID=2125989 RepID=A0A8J6M306_9ALTE|nr:diguanylate cyclase [Neptunicella marina]MBC3766988.1 diguanylate cyclase [Neptunicella marina]
MDSAISTLTSRIGDFLGTSEDGYAIYSPQDILLGCNKAYANILYRDEAELIGKGFNDIILLSVADGMGPKISDSDPHSWLKKVNQQRRSKAYCLFEIELSDGRWFLISEQILLGSGDMLVQAKNITKQKQREMTLYEHSFQLSNLASIDELTQIANRRSFIAQSKTELNRANRFNNPVTFCLLDIDYFKQVNDEYGHVFGDKVLKMFADKVKPTLRQYDVFGRMGGEEFGILLPNTNQKQSLDIMQRLRCYIAGQFFTHNNKSIQLTTSIGTASCQQEYDFDQLYNNADIALYEAKSSGRNQVVPTLSLLL